MRSTRQACASYSSEDSSSTKRTQINCVLALMILMSERIIAFSVQLTASADRYRVDYWLRGSSVGSRCIYDLGLQEILVSKHEMVQPHTMSNSLLAMDNIHIDVTLGHNQQPANNQP